MELVDRELIAVIGWAKQIPSFPDLPLNDQMHLLQTTWCEVMIFTFCARSMEINPRAKGLMFAKDLTVTSPIASQAGFGDLFSRACRLIEMLLQLRITKEEYVLVKCLILLNGGCALENHSNRDGLRDLLIRGLCQTSLNGNERVAHLLLLLPHVRQLDGVARKYWFNIKDEGLVVVPKLFLEMLESAQRLSW